MHPSSPFCAFGRATERMGAPEAANGGHRATVVPAMGASGQECSPFIPGARLNTLCERYGDSLCRHDAGGRHSAPCVSCCCRCSSEAPAHQEWAVPLLGWRENAIAHDLRVLWHLIVQQQRGLMPPTHGADAIALECAELMLVFTTRMPWQPMLAKRIVDLLDRDRDGRIREDDFVAGLLPLACAGSSGSGSSERAVRLEFLFRCLDLEDVGTISRESLLVYLHLAAMQQCPLTPQPPQPPQLRRPPSLQQQGQQHRQEEVEQHQTEKRKDDGGKEHPLDNTRPARAQRSIELERLEQLVEATFAGASLDGHGRISYEAFTTLLSNESAEHFLRRLHFDVNQAIVSQLQALAAAECFGPCAPPKLPWWGAPCGSAWLVAPLWHAHWERRDDAVATILPQTKPRAV